jgi:hypothetical protein
MPVDHLFLFATAAFAWGVSLATYRWFAVLHGWPMGEWQAHRPMAPIAVGLFAVLMAMLFALARGGATVVTLPFLGILCALAWISLTRVGAQASLLLAPAAVVGLVISWIFAAATVEFEGTRTELPSTAQPPTAAEVDRGITTGRQPEQIPADKR